MLFKIHEPKCARWATATNEIGSAECPIGKSGLSYREVARGGLGDQNEELRRLVWIFQMGGKESISPFPRALDLKAC